MAQRNCANTATRKPFFSKFAKNGRQKETRKREPADTQMKKGEKRLSFKIINYASTILFCKNYKKKI